MSYFLIYFNITENLYKPKNDKGIVLWWLCCLNLVSKNKNDLIFEKKSIFKILRKNFFQKLVKKKNEFDLLSEN
jgi:hypothetical protein